MSSEWSLSSGLPTKTLYVSLLSPIRATCVANPVLLYVNVTSPTIFNHPVQLTAEHSNIANEDYTIYSPALFKNLYAVP